MKAAQRHIIGLSVAGIVLAAHACGPAPKVQRLHELFAELEKTFRKSCAAWTMNLSPAS